VPGKDDVAAGPALDFELVLPSHFFVGFARRNALGMLGESPFHLLPKEEIIEVHCESPAFAPGTRYGCGN